MSPTLGQVTAEVARHTYSVTSEMELHEALQDVLELAFPGEVRREVRLEDDDGLLVGRIDFVVGTVGIEVKIKGQTAAVRRQLQRYQAAPELGDLLLVTTRHMHADAAPEDVGVVIVGGRP